VQNRQLMAAARGEFAGFELFLALLFGWQEQGVGEPVAVNKAANVANPT
jgi:hypothetical protein